MAIPDHPWTKATDKAAAVRIAMTVAAAGRFEGVLREVDARSEARHGSAEIELSAKVGRINADLTVGVDVTCERKRFRANEGLVLRPA